jgi:GTP cyclohydrolase I
MEGEWATFPWEKGIAGPEDNVRRILQYLGETPSREGLRDTPKRVVRSWERLFGGYKQNPQEILRTQFGETSGYDEMVVLKKIRFFSTCEHHMLPFYGHATVAYIPRDRVVGISKLARLVEVFSRRLQIQERLTEEIAGAIQEALDPVGVGVTMTAKHFCMISRGVEKESAEMTTSKLIGAFQTPEVRAEFFNLSL